jgi:hypothetical protein
MINKIQKDCKEVKRKMAFEKTQPDYSGDGIAIWKAVDKNGKEYLKVKVLGSSHNINCFSVEKKKTE